jgi:hypothetical protein
VIDEGSPRATDRRKASLTGKTTVLQWGGGRSGLGRPGFDVRAFKRTTRPAGDEAPDTSSRLAVSSREHSVRRLELLAEVGSASLKRRARWRHRLSPENSAAGCQVHGCSSLTMWVASVGRTRPARLSKPFNPKGSWRASQLEESRGTFDNRCRGVNRAIGARNRSPRVNNQADGIGPRRNSSPAFEHD